MTKLATTLLFISFSIFSFAQKLHEPAEILAILEKSKLSYGLSELKEPVSPPDHTFNLNSADFYRKIEPNSMVTMKVELTDEALKIKEEAEVFFKQKNYTAARNAYEKVLKLHPEYSKLITYIGQTYHAQGDEKKAIEHFKKAINNNFIDYVAHWFLGKSYLHNNQLDKALDEIVTAHILNRNHKLITQDLILVLKELGYEYTPWTFTPQIRLTKQDAEKIKVDFQKEWLGYSLVKAVWAFEPGYSESMGVKEGERSILEEREALVSLLVGNIDDKSFSKQPMFITLREALDNQQIDAFILYEIFMVDTPFIAYQFPEDLVKQLKEYILESRCKASKKKKKKRKKK